MAKDISGISVTNPTERVDYVKSDYTGSPYDWGVTAGYEPQKALEDIPNYEKLTGTEKWLMNKLPGFAESNVGQALAKFNDTWAGQALQYLDVGAEFLERSVGLGAQWMTADELGKQEISSNLKSAWQAGTLYSDLVNAPIFRDGKFIIPDELPGLDGVVKARKQLMAGMSVEEVRANALNDLDALALRAQKQDALFHIFGDPLNYLLPMIKPVEAVQAARLSLLTTGALPDQLASHLDDLERLTKIATNIDDVADLTKLSDETGDVLRLQNILEDLVSQGKQANKADLLEELGILQSRASDFRALSPAEQKFLRFSGGIPGVEDTSAFGKLAASKWNPFALTPEARAVEQVDQVVSNISEYLLGKDLAPDEIVRAIKRAADGTLSPQFGHMVITPEGRIVKGSLQAISADAEDMFRAYTELGNFERPILGILEGATGESAPKILEYLDDPQKAKAFFARAETNIKKSPELAAELERILGGQAFTPELLEGVRKVIGDSDIYSEQLFRSALFTKVADSVAQTSIGLFGVTERGVFQKAADTLKAAESLAFLQMNPSYPINNLINNFFTNVARGNWGTFTWSDAQISKFWDEVVGYVPPRALSGMTAGELAELSVDAQKASTAGVNALRSGSSLVFDELRGNKPGALGKIKDAIGNFGIKNAKGESIDFGMLAQQIERRSGQKATISGWLQGEKAFWKEGVGFDKIDDYDPNLASLLGDDTTKSIHRAISSAMNEKEMREIIFDSDNINININAVTEDAMEKLGYELDTVFDDLFVASIADDIKAGMKNGNLTEVFSGVRKNISDHLDELAEGSREAMKNEALALSKAEKSGALPKLWSEATSDMLATQEKHAMNMQRLSDDIRDTVDPVIRNQRWRTQQAESTRYYNRFWKRHEARFEGLSQAMTESNIPGGDMLLDSFKSWRKEWEGFFSKRNSMLDEYFDAVLEGKTPKRTFDEIQNELDLAYNRAVGLEDVYNTKIDELLIDMVPKEQRALFAQIRSEVADLRFADKQLVIEFREKLKNALPDERAELWDAHWKDRMNIWARIKKTEDYGLAGLEGNQEAAALFNAAQRGESDTVMSLARKFGIPTATENGAPLNKRVVDTVNKYLRGEYGGEVVENAPQFNDIMEIPADAAKEAFRARLVDGVTNGKEGVSIPKGMSYQDFQRIIDEADPSALSKYLDDLEGVRSSEAAFSNFHDIVPKERFDAVGFDQLYFNRGADALDELEASARKIAAQPPLRFNDLPEEAQKSLRNYMAVQEGKRADVRNAVSKFANFKRDSALLDYSRRTNFDNWAGNIFPYEFWVTHSVFNWALHSLDRPAMLSSYFRMKKFLDTGFRPESGFPSRLKGSIRIKLPFLPKVFGEWMGDTVFINPLDAAIPVGKFGRPVEEYLSQNMRDIGQVERVLEEQLQDGTITQQQYLEATQTRQGKVWDQAYQSARLDDAEGRLNWMDFATMMTAPHAPIMWAYQASQGNADEIGPFLPITRTIKGVTGLLGINEGRGLNPEANIRKAMGLHPFDGWDDYRAERMLVNMIATGEVNADEAKRAMLEHSGPLWSEATRRAGIEYGVGVLGSLTGIPTKSYPPGEEIVREKRDEYEAAWKLYEQGDTQAIFDWLDENPDYEARLALFKSPEERLNRFLVDQIWDTYNNAYDVDKALIRDTLGEDFVNSFLVKETRSTGSIPAEQLSVWLKLMGGDPVGTLGGNVTPIQFAPPEEAQLAQFFYDTRRQQFSNYYELQNQYYSLPQSARSAFLRQNPSLSDYWNWRRDFMQRNPAVVKYLTDNEEQIQEANGQLFYNPYQQSLTPQEVEARYSEVLGRGVYNQILDYLLNDDPLDQYTRERLAELGVTEEQILTEIEIALGIAQ